MEFPFGNGVMFLLSSGGNTKLLTCNSCRRRGIALLFTPFPAGESHLLLSLQN